MLRVYMAYVADGRNAGHYCGVPLSEQAQGSFKADGRLDAGPHCTQQHTHVTRYAINQGSKTM
jgi:hypothetical protein